jgi:hypothetical protein
MAAWLCRAATRCRTRASSGVGKNDGLAAQSEGYLVAVGLDLIEGEAADCCWPLCVEEDEQAGDAVFGFEGFVVE